MAIDQHLAARLIERLGARATKVALDLPDELAFENWEAIGRVVVRVEPVTAWWIGDWINFGFAVYGQKYEEALEQTGLNYGTLRNIAYVCDHVDVSRRRDNLSFSHHREIVSLPREEQDEFLERAERAGWSVRRLRAEVAARLS
jgi:hypothetical protein